MNWNNCPKDKKINHFDIISCFASLPWILLLFSNFFLLITSFLGFFWIDNESNDQQLWKLKRVFVLTVWSHRLATRSSICCKYALVKPSHPFVAGHHAPWTEAAVQIQEILVCSSHDGHGEPEGPFSQSPWQGKTLTSKSCWVLVQSLKSSRFVTETKISWKSCCISSPIWPINMIYFYEYWYLMHLRTFWSWSKMIDRSTPTSGSSAQCFYYKIKKSVFSHLHMNMNALDTCLWKTEQLVKRVIFYFQFVSGKLCAVSCRIKVWGRELLKSRV